MALNNIQFPPLPRGFLSDQLVILVYVVIIKRTLHRKFTEAVFWRYVINTGATLCFTPTGLR